MSITFDIRQFEFDLINEMRMALDEIGYETYKKTWTNLYTEEGRDSLKADGIKFIDRVAKIITYQLSGGADYIMDIYGTGSLMDKDNPFLDEYKRSNLYNKLRPDDNSLVTRPAGEYTDIYGKPRTAKGPGNIPMEETPLGKMLLNVPSNAFEKAISEEHLPREFIVEVINRAFKRLNFKRYFIIRPNTLKRKL